MICFRHVSTFLACTFLGCSLARAQVTPAAGEEKLKRSVVVRAHEVFDKRKLRLFVVVDEADTEGRYLLNTLDARSFRLSGKDSEDAPVEVVSLSTIVTKSPPVQRETAIIFESSAELTQQQSDGIRKAVASFLGGYRSDVLSVRMGNEENSSRLAWISPSQSENPRAIQRSVLDSPVLAGARGLTPALCDGIRDLNVIDSQGTGPHVQRNVIVVSSDMPSVTKSFGEMAKCLSEADDIGARVFWVRLRSAPPGAENSGKFAKTLSAGVFASNGFTHSIPLSADPLPALNNVRSYLDDEYILEFDLDRLKPYSDTIELELTASYHGNIIKSGFFEAEGFTPYPSPEDIARQAQIQDASRRKEIFTVGLIVGILSLTGIFFWFRLKKNVHVCQECSFVVARNFQDCPFRNPKCYGRLSVIHGPLLGKVFPLFSGENTLGSRRSSMVRLRGRGVAADHAKIVLSKRKALYSPAKGSECRINGIAAIEPRLLGSGSVIRIGDCVCRVDFKEGE